MNKIKSTKKGGYVLILNTLIFISIILVILTGLSGALLSIYSAASGSLSSKRAYLVAHSAVDEAMYRLKTGKVISDSETITLGSIQSLLTVSATPTGKSVLATADVNGYTRNIRVNLALGSGVSFHYGIQAGQGGFVLQNSSSVTGNVFSSGQIIGSGDNFIRGDAVSAGPTGQISGIHATGSAFAHIIQNSTVDADAYYTSISGSTVGGTLYPNSPDQTPAPLPISDAKITEWEQDAEISGHIATCTSGAYTISEDITIGPLKVPCNLNINGTGGGITITINGPIWVLGNITSSNKVLIRMHPDLGNNNVAIIADNPANRTSSSRIIVGQNTSFEGSGAEGSYTFMISQNNSSETGVPATPYDAIQLNNGASAMVAYAAHGQITLAQSVSIKEVTAFKIILQNTANVIYDRGLPSVLFKAGPGGGYERLSWLEF